MRVKAISWVGVKTDSYREMREFFSGVAGLPVDFETTHPPEQFSGNDVVASLLVENIDAAIGELGTAGIELLGERGEGGDGYFWQHFRAPDGKVFELVADPAHP